MRSSFSLALPFALFLAASAVACGSGDDDPGDGGDQTEGTGGTGATGGSATAGKGGSTTAGKGGSATAGKGGSAGTSGSAGSAQAGKGGSSTAGSGGSGQGGSGTAGTAGSSTAGSGGSGQAGSGTAGSGGSGTAGKGGSGSAGKGGSGTAGKGGSAGSGQAGSGQAGSGQAGSGQAGSGQAGSGQAGSGSVITPDDPGAADVQIKVDATADVHPISRFIYGTNMPEWNGKGKNLTAARLGGNRWTAYNWENNASNAGSDWNHQNDDYLGGGNTPGEAVRAPTAAAAAADAAMLVTIPMVGYVAADKNGGGDVNQTPNYLQTRFKKSVPTKGSAFTTTPSTSDDSVYQDEFVSFLLGKFPGAATDPTHPIFFSMDNEPDLWNSTHARIHPKPVGYAELEDDNLKYAAAVKSVAPDATVFGPVNYGWAGFVNLQDAPDANGKDFIEDFLDKMSAAEQKAGKRLVDVLDVHWYPEAQGDGVRIVDDGSSNGLYEARMQAPRSLWDAGYKETSWITQWSTLGPINLIPRLKQKIASHYPGTKLSFSEYFYGGGTHISGGIAEADVLGIFGRDDVFWATLWYGAAKQGDFIYAAMAMYRNFDGAGGSFGDTSVQTSTDKPETSSAYGSIDAANPGRTVIVVINKESTARTAGIAVTQTVAYGTAHVYQLTSASAAPVKGADIPITKTNAFTYSMPARSVSTIVLELRGVIWIAGARSGRAGGPILRSIMSRPPVCLARTVWEK